MSSRQNYWTARVRRRSLLAGLGTGLAGATGLALVGCGSSSDNNRTATKSPGSTATSGASNGPKRGGTVTVAFGSDTDELDPGKNSFTAETAIALCHATLTTADSTGTPNHVKINPYLASGVQQPEPNTLVYTIRKGATFQDLAPVNGRAVTAKDAKFSIDRQLTGGASFLHATQISSIDSVTATDDSTLTIKLKSPDATFPLYFSQVWFSVVAPETESMLTTKPIGAGPFIMTDWTHNVGFKFKRNDKWWLPGQPYLDGVQQPVITDPSATLAAFRTGKTNWYWDVPLENQDEISGDKQFSAVTSGEIANQYVRINQKKKPFQDVRIRQALSCAMDRDAVVTTAFHGKGKPNGVIPWAVDLALPPAELDYYKLDVQKAKQLWDAAGAQDLEFTNLFPSNASGANLAYINTVMDQWQRNLGAKVTNKPLEYNAYLAAAQKGDFDVNLHWGLGYPEIGGYLTEFVTGGGRNYGGWGSADLDTKIAAAKVQLDADKRKSLLDEIQKEIAANGWCPQIGDWNAMAATVNNLEGLGINGTEGTMQVWLRQAYFK